MTRPKTAAATSAALTLLFLSSAALLAGDKDLTIKGETSVGPYRLVRLKAENVPEKAGVLWKVTPLRNDPKNPVTVDWASKKNVREVVWVAPPGTYTVSLSVGVLDKDGNTVLDGAEAVVVVSSPTPPTPTPPSPTPPGPQPPGPVPPGPTPDPAAPFAGLTGLRVLVVYESGDLSKLSAAQQGAIYARSVRDYLNAKCPVGPDGKTREWRMYDADADLSGEAKTWQDALKLPRTGLPWVYVGNGTAGYSGPLPADADAMLALLKKYGEGK